MNAKPNQKTDDLSRPLTVGEHKQQLQQSINHHRRVLRLMIRASPQDPHIDNIRTIIGGMEAELKRLENRPSKGRLLPGHG